MAGHATSGIPRVVRSTGNSRMPKNLADTVVNKTLRVRPDETVIINTWQQTLTLASQLAYETRHAGALPLITLETDEYYWKSLTELAAENLRKPLHHNLALLDETDASINLAGPAGSHDLQTGPGTTDGRLFDSYQPNCDKPRHFWLTWKTF